MTPMSATIRSRFVGLAVVTAAVLLTVFWVPMHYGNPLENTRGLSDADYVEPKTVRENIPPSTSRRKADGQTLHYVLWYRGAEPQDLRVEVAYRGAETELELGNEALAIDLGSGLHGLYYSMIYDGSPVRFTAATEQVLQLNCGLWIRKNATYLSYGHALRTVKCLYKHKNQ